MKDERGYSADIGARSRNRGRLAYDVSLFYIAIQDRIGLLLQTDTVLFNDYRYRTNIADAGIVGLEGYAEYELFRSKDVAGDSAANSRQTVLSVFANVATIRANYIRTDDASIRHRQVELVPPFTLRTGLQWQIWRIKTAFTLAYTAQQYSDATNTKFSSTAVNGLIPAYTVADVSAQYAINKTFQLEASVNNVLNARYFTRRAESYPGPGIIPADARGGFITLQARF
jgi:Fe(3+) dicitrate transport protein